MRPHHGHGRRHGGGRSARRTRGRDSAGGWWVQARVERFVEAALLQVLAEGPTHGYDLADAIEEIAPGERVDLGNLYRLLRSLEEEGVVRSEWRDDLGGPAKRTYQLTTEGHALLATWIGSLGDLQGTLADFGRRHQPTPTSTDEEHR